jgi:hypothetical protein
MAQLQLALPFLGDGKWPALDAVFPFRWDAMTSGGREILATTAMLGELERFADACARSNAWSLHDTDRDARISGHAFPDHIRRITLWGNAGIAHLDRGEFVVMRHDDELFRAAAFTQVLVEAEAETYAFTNMDTGATYTSTAHYKSWVPDTRYEQYVPKNLAVVERPVDPAEYANTIDDLLDVVRASLATGNPIVWLV